MRYGADAEGLAIMARRARCTVLEVGRLYSCSMQCDP
jgi:hypothetical protein